MPACIAHKTFQRWFSLSALGCLMHFQHFARTEYLLLQVRDRLLCQFLRTTIQPALRPDRQRSWCLLCTGVTPRCSRNEAAARVSCLHALFIDRAFGSRVNSAARPVPDSATHTCQERAPPAHSLQAARCIFPVAAGSRHTLPAGLALLLVGPGFKGCSSYVVLYGL